MNDATLQFLLDFAEHDQPIQHLYFKRNPAICFRELLSEGYLTPANAPDEIYTMIDGESYLVHYMNAEGKTVCWCTVEGRPVELDPMVCSYYRIDYTPLARLLMKHLRTEVPDDQKVPNHAWDLGMPDAFLNEVHLVRNGGTNDHVKLAMADYDSKSAVYWFGTEPDKKSTKATLYRLSSYLECVDGKIRHKNKIPDCLIENDATTASACPNRIMKRGKCTYEFYFEGKGPASISYILGAEYLPRIINAGSAGIPIIEVVSGKKLPGKKISREDQEAHGMEPERAIRRLSKDDIVLYKTILKQLEDELSDLEKYSDDKELIEVKRANVQALRKALNESKNFDDGISKLCHHVRAACMGALCNQLKKQGMDAFAKHLNTKGVIVIGAWCRYQPMEKTEWDIHI